MINAFRAKTNSGVNPTCFLIAEDSEELSPQRSCGEQHVSHGADCQHLCIRRICKGRCVVRIWSLSWTELFAIQQSREPTIVDVGSTSRAKYHAVIVILTPRENEEVILESEARVSFGNEARSSCHRQLLRR